jgi:hypothetical protein
MSNSLITPTQVLREALVVAHQSSNFLGSIDRQYDNQFAQKGAKIGNTLNIRQPNKYTVRNGATLSAQDTVESTTPLVLSNQMGVDLNFTSQDLTLSLDDFSKRIVAPAVSVLMANVEATVMAAVIPQIYQQVTNNGSAFSFAKTMLGAKRLTDSLAPFTGRSMNLNTQDNVDFVGDTKGLFQDSSNVAKQYRTGKVAANTAGFESVYQNTLWPSLTPGARAGYLVNGANQTGSSLIVNTGTGAAAIGETFTIAGVFEVHPESKAVTKNLQRFVLTAAYAGGAGTMAISPAIVTSGAKQNVSASPANGAAITFDGTAATGFGLSLAYHESAITFATADLQKPNGVDMSVSENLDGISMRLVRAYDIVNDKWPCRLDILFGAAVQRPEWAVRLANN